MQIAILIAAGLLFFFGGLALIVLTLRLTMVDGLSRRLQDYVVDQTAEQTALAAAVQIRRDELSGSFVTRTILPGVKGLGRLFGRFTPRSTLDSLRRQLTIAGNPLGLGPREFYGLRLVFILLGIWMATLVFRQTSGTARFLLTPLTYFFPAYLPKFWLRTRVAARQNKIRKGLPDALDMLSVCAEAGLGFDQSLQRVSEQWKTALGIEFGRVVAEMEMGLSRRAALRNLADRVEVTELTSFVAVILQSDELGMSIADTLHAQAGQMRIERRFRAQEQARKIPLKMLFPMIFLILPALMAVILGPLIPVFLNFFGSLSGGVR
jgi:tight adherence protein C